MRTLNLNTGIDRLINAEAADSGGSFAALDDAINATHTSEQRAALEVELCKLTTDQIEEIVFGDEEGEVRTAMNRLPKSVRVLLRAAFAKIY